MPSSLIDLGAMLASVGGAIPALGLRLIKATLTLSFDDLVMMAFSVGGAISSLGVVTILPRIGILGRPTLSASREDAVAVSIVGCFRQGLHALAIGGFPGSQICRTFGGVFVGHAVTPDVI